MITIKQPLSKDKMLVLEEKSSGEFEASLQKKGSNGEYRAFKKGRVVWW